MRLVPGDEFSAASFRARVANDQGDGDWRQYGDHVLNSDIADHLAGQKLREAAVLVPLVDHGDRAGVLLTQRTETMRTHSGQIAFPGGAVDPDDPSLEAAALREAEEEIGLSPSFVEPVGRLPHYLTVSGFRITPVLAVIPSDYSMTLNHQEVDDAFEVPFDFLMDPANHVRESRVWEGKERHFYTMPYGERYIWGVTAGILRTLYERHYA
jgi:8-oxo-dGTP pyrophosphatase MutT (NUDIX family)